MNRAAVIETYLAAKKTAEVAKAMLEADAVAEYDEQGTAPSWKSASFNAVANLTTSAAVVSDDAALMAFVKFAFPGEVETIERVRPAFRSALLSRVANIDGLPCDTDGTVIPGMTWREGGEYSHVSVTPTPVMRRRLAALAESIQQGALPFRLPLEVEA